MRFIIKLYKLAVPPMSNNTSESWQEGVFLSTGSFPVHKHLFSMFAELEITQLPCSEVCPSLQHAFSFLICFHLTIMGPV